LCYGSSDRLDDGIGYDVDCTSCDYSGIEWYDLVFQFHTDTDLNVIRAGKRLNNGERI